MRFLGLTAIFGYYDEGLCCLSFSYHLFVGVDDVGYLLGVFADFVGEGSALQD